MKELIHNTIIADSKLVQSGKIACQRFRLDVVQILYEPAYPIGNAPRDCRIQPCQITRRRVEDPDLVHRLFQPELSNNIIERLALLPSRDLLPLAHESLPDIATDCQALIGISEYPQQRPLYRRFHDGPEHLLELRLSHSSNRLGSHFAILSRHEPIRCQLQLVSLMRV